MTLALMFLACAGALAIGGYQFGAIGCAIVGAVLLVNSLPEGGCGHDCNQGRACEPCKLKQEAAGHYNAYFDIVGSLGVGAALAEEFRPDAIEHKHAYNRLMDELAKIDYSAPTFRL